MKSIKIGSIYCIDNKSLESTIIFNLIRILCKKKIEICNWKDADLLFIGPYSINSIYSRFNLSLKRRLKFDFNNFFLKKKNKIKIFFSHENYRYETVQADYYITSDLGVENENHLRIPAWKDYIDWKSEGFIQHKDSLNSKRYGEYYDINQLFNNKNEFLKKKKSFCMFSSHMIEPRRSIYNFFSKKYKIDGYGPYFNSTIKNHNSSSFFKKNIMKDYSFNICPQNSLYPGYYGENIPDAFLANCLPITWCDNNVSLDFNKKCFINLLNFSENINEAIEMFNDNEALKKFSYEPLMFKKPDLSKEIQFAKKIVERLETL